LNAVGARADYLNVLRALYLKGHFKKIAISRSQLYMYLKTMLFGRLSLLPGHGSPHTSQQQGMNARVRSARQRSKPPSRG